MKWEQALDDLIVSIRTTQEYQDYQTAKGEIKKRPDLKNRLDEFRRKNFEVQNSDEKDGLFEKMEALEQEYGEFWSNPFVEDFLDSELAFCRMVQEIYRKITDALEFE